MKQTAKRVLDFGLRKFGEYTLVGFVVGVGASYAGLPIPKLTVDANASQIESLKADTALHERLAKCQNKGIADCEEVTRMQHEAYLKGEY